MRDLLLGTYGCPSNSRSCRGIRTERKVFPILRRQALRPARAVAEHVQCFSGGQQFAGRVVQDFVGKANGAPASLGNSGANPQQVVVTSRTQITAMCFRHDDESAVLPLHLFIGDAAFAHIFHPADLEKYEIVSVVDHVHLVGLSVAHARDRFRKSAHVVVIRLTSAAGAFPEKPTGPRENRAWSEWLRLRPRPARCGGQFPLGWLAPAGAWLPERRRGCWR